MSSYEEAYAYLERHVDALKTNRTGDERQTDAEVFDRKTLLTIYDMMTSGYIDQVHYPISTGKEGNVFYATDEDGVNKMMLYDKFKLGIEFPTADNTKTYTITGILGSAKLSGSEVKELFPTKAVEETVSGIGSIEAENAQEAVYNLNGQRLAKPQKGLNIIGGKKVIVK